MAPAEAGEAGEIADSRWPCHQLATEGYCQLHWCGGLDRLGDALAMKIEPPYF
jgi:hypothetical protein